MLSLALNSLAYDVALVSRPARGCASRSHARHHQTMQARCARRHRCPLTTQPTADRHEGPGGRILPVAGVLVLASGLPYWYVLY